PGCREPGAIIGAAPTPHRRGPSERGAGHRRCPIRRDYGAVPDRPISTARCPAKKGPWEGTGTITPSWYQGRSDSQALRGAWHILSGRAGGGRSLRQAEIPQRIRSGFYDEDTAINRDEPAAPG